MHLLLGYGADCFALGKCLMYSGTPLDIAKQIGRPDMVCALREACACGPVINARKRSEGIITIS